MQPTNFSLEARCWHIMAHIGAVIKIWLDRGGEQNIIYFFHTPRQICYRKLTIIPRDYLPFFFYFLTQFQPLSCAFHLIFACYSWLRSWTELMFWLALQFSFQAHCFSHNCCSVSISSKTYCSIMRNVQILHFYLKTSPPVSVTRQRWNANSL